MQEGMTSPINRGQIFKDLFHNFLEIDKGIEAIIVSDEEGFVIAGEKRKDIDIELVSFLTAVVNPLIERMRNEFAFKRFGTASFDTDEHRLIFISIDQSTTLSLVFEDNLSIDKLYPYAYYLTEKIAQILRAVPGDKIELTIPNFEFEEELSKQSNRIKYQIYRGKLEQEDNFRFKFIIIGDHEVGKTSLVRRFVENRFLDDYHTTIGLNILSHNHYAFGNNVNLVLWDLGAQKYFRRYRKTYYSGAQAAFIVFDLTSRDSFNNILKWYKELTEFIEDKNIPIILVGNKKDLLDQRAIEYEEGIALAKELSNRSELSDFSDLSGLIDFSDLSGKIEGNISYIETSALTGDQVEDAFNLVSYHFMIRSKELEENKFKNKITKEINSILKNYGNLQLVFITEDPLWSPVLQIFTEINELGEYVKVKDKLQERQYEYSSGLVIKNYVYDSLKYTQSDGVFCIFDAREKEHIDPKWGEMLNDLIEKIEGNKALLIGIRISETIDWSKLMEEFDISEEMEERIGSVLFFKISEKNELEIYELLEFLLNFIKQRLLSTKLENKTEITGKLEQDLKVKEEKIQKLSSKVSELKKKIEHSSVSSEIRAKKSKYKSISTEDQLKRKSLSSQIEALKDKIIKYENKGENRKKIKEAWYDLSRALIKSHDYDRAIEALQNAIELDSKYLEALNVLGAVYFGKGEYNKSVDTFQRLLKLRPKDPIVWYNIGRAYIKNGEYYNAIVALEHTIKLKPDMVNAWNLLAASYYVNEDFFKSIKAYERLSNIMPLDHNVWYNLGRAYIRNGEYDKAIETLERALKIDGNYSPAWNVLGASYFGKGEYNQSVDAFKNFVKLDPTDHVAWYNLAEALFATQNYEDALDACNSSLDIDFNFEEALNLRERILANL
ncbi:MAG: tetratricopeptide repeat protein [Promethearchaeota archaeon]|nr:MAG: tetratricopeptide repeat protein [Candidatus Lokiarchaeota archaeon]